MVKLAAGRTATQWDGTLDYRHGSAEIRVTTIGLDYDIAVCGTGGPRADALLYVLPAQIPAVHWSAKLGLDTDDPFGGHALSRAVRDVPLCQFCP